MTQKSGNKSEKPESSAETRPEQKLEQEQQEAAKRPREFGGPKGLEPTRYGDWEQNGRCTDF